MVAIALLEEGAHADALRKLDDAAEGVSRIARHSPGMLALWRAHRAWALAGSGRVAEASREVAEARPMLLATPSGRDVLTHVTKKMRAIVERGETASG